MNSNSACLHDCISFKFKVQETPIVNVNELQPSESPASVSASKGKGRGRKRIQPSAAELEACDENAF